MYAFYGCSALTNISFPDTMKVIESQAFASFGGKTITLPASLVNIGGAAFMNGFLTNVTIMATNPPKMPVIAFLPSVIKFIRVPAGSLTNYQTATDSWTNFYSNLVEQ